MRPVSDRSFSFVLAVPIGVLLLWVTGFAALMVQGGDCFGSVDECGADSDIRVVQARVLEVIVAGLSVLGFLAIAVGRRVMPAALLAASVGTLVLGLSSGATAFWWVPRGLGLTLFPVAILALAAAGQVMHQVEWRPMWLRMWRGE